MKSIILTIIMSILCVFSFADSLSTTTPDTTLPRYYVDENGITVVMISIEQLQKLDSDKELLTLFEKLSLNCDSLDTYYVAVINDMNEKVALLEGKISNFEKQLKKNDDQINDLKQQVKNREDNILESNAIIANDTLIISGLKADLKKQENNSAWGWIGTGLLGALAIISTVLYIAK